MFEMLKLNFIVQALVVSLITGLFLSYMGLHVVGRGIVFVDLALGQIASLGSAFAAFAGYGLTVFPLVFTLIGAILISMINILDKRLKLEAVIGILYAFCSAATVMLISKTPHGDSDVQEVLFGNILSVNNRQIVVIGIVYAILVLIHVLFHKKFFELNESFRSSDKKNARFNIWNFLFYITIGLSIVFAVRIAGVIPVFSYLIFPSVCAIMLVRAIPALILIALIISLLGSYFGLYVSYHFDYPAGSSIVAVLGIIFIAISFAHLLKNLIVKRSQIKKSN